jgi:cysteine desulfurase
MHVNNETGVIQPIEDIAEVLSGSEALFHTDAAQGFGKELQPLKNKRIDLISVSGHKICGPKGVGALVMRKRGFKPPPIMPLAYGGGQERGFRPGTLPVALIAGLGLASELANREADERAEKCAVMKEVVLKTFHSLGAVSNGDEHRVISHVVNLSLRGLDSEAVMLALKGLVAISNGSACTSESYEPSHVLTAMGIGEEATRCALRISWSHTTAEPNWDEILGRIRELL